MGVGSARGRYGRALMSAKLASSVPLSSTLRHKVHRVVVRLRAGSRSTSDGDGFCLRGGADGGSFGGPLHERVQGAQAGKIEFHVTRPACDVVQIRVRRRERRAREVILA